MLLEFNDHGNKIYSTQLGIGDFPEVESRKATELLFFTVRMGKFKIQPEKIQDMSRKYKAYTYVGAP